MSTPIRWGFLSTAGIGRKNWDSIRLSGNGVVAGVASRDLARAQNFIAECQEAGAFAERPRAFASYDELIASPEIDAIYNPLPTALRKEWIIRAAEAGKHVLCEKPCAVDAEDLREMQTACRLNRVLFMDGVMFMHSARLPALRALLDDGESAGKLRRVSCAFGFNGGEDFLEKNIRANPALEPAGSLGDLGWYCIRLALWAAKGEMPLVVTGRILEEAGTAVIAFSGELIFAAGLSSTFYCAFNSGNFQWTRLEGDAGYLFMDDFVQASPERTEVSFFHNGNLRTVAERPVKDTSAQATNLFRNFADLARSEPTNQTWSELSLKTQQIQDAAYRSARINGAPVVPANC